MRLKAMNIFKSFGGVHALKNINFDISSGEVQCLAGGNGCGKSTIVKILSGVLRPDSGSIEVDGENYSALTARQAIDLGIAVIHQDLSLFNTMTVKDNICLPEQVHHRRFFINNSLADKVAKEALERIGANINCYERVENLSMAARQQVAIARALVLNAKVIFMDEPTTALTYSEVEELLKTIENLKLNGVSVVFISHKLDEVFSVADRITVFRSGELVGTYNAKDLNPRKLSSLMIGHDVQFGIPNNYDMNKEVVPTLNMEDVKASRVNGVTLSVNPGEVVGFSGLLGSGRTETALALFGLNHITSGSVKINGKIVDINNPRDAIERGIALVPEDRYKQGLFQDSNLLSNCASAILSRISNCFGIVNQNEEKIVGDEILNDLQVNTHDLSLLAKSLSGGNQQKVLLGKWVATNPKLLILDSPTVGVDVGSKSQIYQIIRRLAEKGISVIVISDEEEELLAVCNKIYIFKQGKVSTQITGDELEPGFSKIFRESTDRDNSHKSNESFISSSDKAVSFVQNGGAL